MDLIKKKYELLEERTVCEQAKQDAHNRIIEINKTLKKLENLIAEADEILGGLYPYPEYPEGTSHITIQNDSNEMVITQAINER